MILKVVFCHWMRTNRGLIFVRFADYSGFVVEAHLQNREYAFRNILTPLDLRRSRFNRAHTAKKK